MSTLPINIKSKLIRTVLSFPFIAIATVSMTHADIAMAAADKDAERISSMYLSAFVNSDVAGAEALNALLKPAYDGKDALAIAVIKNQGAEQTDAMFNVMLDVIPEEQQGALKVPLRQFVSAMIAAVERSKCTVKGSSVAPNSTDPTGNSKVATVTFECLAPNVNSAAAAILAKMPKDSGLPSPSQFTQLAAVYNNAPATLTVAGTMNVHNDGMPGIWYTGSPQEARGLVLAQLMAPLHMK
jgi:hypothetical protein